MDLQPDAVELPLDVGGMDPTEGVRRVDRRLRQHGVEGPKDGKAESAEAGLALGDGRGGHGAQVALEHERAAHLRDRNPGRGGHALDHAPLESALPQLADQQAGQELLFGVGRGGQQRRELLLRACWLPAPTASRIRSSAASTSISPSVDPAAGGGRSRSEAHPTPIVPCGNLPDRYATAIGSPRLQTSQARGE